MNIIKLPDDIIWYICLFIDTDQDKFKFLATCKRLSKLLNKIDLHNKYEQQNVIDKKYYQQITKLVRVNKISPLPKKLNYIMHIELHNINNNNINNLLNLHTLILDDIKFELDLDIYILPKNLQVLHVDSFKQKLKPNILPNKLQELQITRYYDDFDEDVLPQSLIYLVLNIFNRKLKPDVLPKKLQKLNLFLYNQDFDENVLPQSLKYLRLHEFDQKLKPNVLPKSLQELDLHRYNEDFDENVLPQSLKILDLYDFDQKLKPNILPNKLQELNLHRYNNDFDKNVLPQSLKHLKLFIFNKKFKSLPDGLQILNCHTKNEIEKFPSALRELRLYRYTYTMSNYVFEPLQLPETLIKLTLNQCDIIITKDYLPKSLKELILVGTKTRLVLNSHCIPDSLKIFTLIDYKYDLPLLPDSIEELYLYNCNDKLKQIPKKIKILQQIDKRFSNFDLRDI